MTTCEWRDIYACYQEAVCERQSSGSCGWTTTDAFTACIARGGESRPDRAAGSAMSSSSASSESSQAQVSSAFSSEPAYDEEGADLSQMDERQRQLIERMADEDYAPDRWTQVHCSSHVEVCMEAHKNWWYKSFGSTASVLWHFELGAAPVEVFGDGPIHVDLKTGSLASLGIADQSVQVIGNRVIGYREWTENRHFEVSAVPQLYEPVRIVTRRLRPSTEGE